MQKKHVVLGVTGSIAAYKAADVARELLDKGYEVSVVMTPSAEKFISPLTFSALTGNKVYRDMFVESDSGEMPHIDLAKQADVIVISPATANVIGKISCGLADDLLTCIVMASNAKVIIVPAMNTQMYENKIVQDNILKLKKIGFVFVDPIKGKLACNTVGQGHIADVGQIISYVEKIVRPKK